MRVPARCNRQPGILKTIFSLILISCFCLGALHAQTTPLDSVALQHFWKTCVQPVLDQDAAKMKSILYFPLQGKFAGRMFPEQERTEKSVTSPEFFAHLSVVFNDSSLKYLRQLSPEDVYQTYAEGYQELLVSNGWERPYTLPTGAKSHTENGIILRYRYLKGRWRLHAIECMF